MAARKNTVSASVGADKTADFDTLRALVRSYGMLGVARMLTHINGFGQGRGRAEEANLRTAERAIKDALRGVIQKGEFRHVRSVLPTVGEEETAA
jgi:hypothetical protein